MGSTELRIGNLVTDEYYDSFKTIIEVYSIDDRGINLSIEDDGNYPELAQTWIEPYYRSDQLFGIPLTEEWLLKFGFEICDYGEVHSMCFTGYRVKNSIWDVYAVSNGEFVLHKNTKETSITNIKYVHQLQNLYFSLTGGELIYQKI